MAMGSDLVSAGRMLTCFGFWLATTNVHPHVSFQSRTGSPLQCARQAPGRGSVDLLGYEVSSANAYCSGTGKRISRIRLSRTYGLFAPSHQQVGQWSSSMVTSLSWRSAIAGLNS